MFNPRFLFPSLAAIIAILAFFAILFSGPNSQATIIGLGLVTIAMLFLYVGFAALRFRRIYLPLAIIGLPKAGKTVYITVLLNELQTNRVENIDFSLSETETIERVETDISWLDRSVWPPPTPPNMAFPYFVDISNHPIFGPRSKYTLMITDFAGEHVGELDASHEMWIHKTTFFSYVVNSSEAFMLALDGEYFVSPEVYNIESIQSSFISAVNVLASYKGAGEGKKLNTPLALMILKADLLGDDSVSALSRIPRLVRVCETIFENFEIFFVSSVGRVYPDGAPPPANERKPQGVLDPMIWILRRYAAQA